MIIVVLLDQRETIRRTACSKHDDTIWESDDGKGCLSIHHNDESRYYFLMWSLFCYLYGLMCVYLNFGPSKIGGFENCHWQWELVKKEFRIVCTLDDHKYYSVVNDQVYCNVPIIGLVHVGPEEMASEIGVGERKFTIADCTKINCAFPCISVYLYSEDMN